jgi:hypothetical protein
MTADNDFEQRARLTLEESVTRLDGATRSRLTQARYRALEQLDTSAARVGGWWRLTGRSSVLAPVGAMAAVVALTTVLWVGRPGVSLPGETGAVAAGAPEDMELLADGDALAAMSEEDPEFYEWALAQDSAADATRGS